MQWAQPSLKPSLEQDNSVSYEANAGKGHALLKLKQAEEALSAFEQASYTQGRREASTTASYSSDSVPLRDFKPTLTVGSRSDPGIKRKLKPNEDSLFAIQGELSHNSDVRPFGLFVIAHGMGAMPVDKMLVNWQFKPLWIMSYQGCQAMNNL